VGTEVWEGQLRQEKTRNATQENAAQYWIAGNCRKRCYGKPKKLLRAMANVIFKNHKTSYVHV